MKGQKKYSTLLNYTVLRGLREQTRNPFVKLKEALGEDSRHYLLKIWLDLEDLNTLRLYEAELALYLRFNALDPRPLGVPRLLAHGEAVYERKRTSDEKVKYMVFEMPRFGKLRTLMGALRQQECLALSKSFMLTLHSLHKLGIVLTHLNINTLMVGEGLEVLALDYFLASESAAEPIALPLQAKYYCEQYLPPEVKDRVVPFGLPADAFMAGLLTFYTLFKATPFRHSATLDDPVYSKAAESPEQFWKFFGTAASALNSDYKSLILGLLNPDPFKRYRLETVLQSEPFAKIDCQAAQAKVEEKREPIQALFQRQIQKRKDRKAKQQSTAKGSAVVFSHPCKRIGSYRDGPVQQKAHQIAIKEFEGCQLDHASQVFVGLQSDLTYNLLRERVLLSKFNRVSEKPEEGKLTGTSLGHQPFQSFSMGFTVFRLGEFSVLETSQQQLTMQAHGRFLECREDVIASLLSEAELES